MFTTMFEHNSCQRSNDYHLLESSNNFQKISPPPLGGITFEHLRYVSRFDLHSQNMCVIFATLKHSKQYLNVLDYK